jgi:hypothetical protein
VNYQQIAAAVYQRCNHFDPYLPPLSPDLARAWGALFEKHRHSEADLLAGVETVYDEHGSGYRPLPADIIAATRRIRQDRYDRSDIHQRGAHEAICDAKGADTLKGIATGVITGPTASTPRLEAAKEALQTCHGRRESMAAIREYFAAKDHAHKPVSVAVADRQCACGRPILTDHDTACDRCTPVINGSEKPTETTKPHHRQDVRTPPNRKERKMSTTTERKPFIAPVIDNAAQFIKERGAVTVSELAEYLSAADVNISGDTELTGEELAYWWRKCRPEFLGLPVIAFGSTEFVRTIAALLINRTVDLDATNPAVLKLTWDGRWGAHRESQPNIYKSRTGGHYHILTVRDPGGSQQVAECWEGGSDLVLAQQYLDEVYLRDFVDEGWDAIWIVGCGSDRCRRDEICNLPVEEWGAPYWGDTTVFPGIEHCFGASA